MENEWQKVHSFYRRGGVDVSGDADDLEVEYDKDGCFTRAYIPWRIVAELMREQGWTVTPPKEATMSSEMRLWKIDVGAIYYAAARTCCEAAEVAIAQFRKEGTDGDDTESITVDEVPKGKRVTILNEDGTKVCAHMEADRTREPMILCCSEWP